MIDCPPEGTVKRTTAWELKRLAEASPDLYRKVERGSLSLHRAMIQSGLKEPQTTVRLNPRHIAEVALRSLSRTEVEELIGHLQASLH